MKDILKLFILFLPGYFFVKFVVVNMPLEKEDLLYIAFVAGYAVGAISRASLIKKDAS